MPAPTQDRLVSAFVRTLHHHRLGYIPVRLRLDTNVADTDPVGRIDAMPQSIGAALGTATDLDEWPPMGRRTIAQHNFPTRVVIAEDAAFVI